ncbi:glycerophosphodiester phosphodiesterase family protein [Priestia megaterium]|uniref:glycerophosphodiester phosphodiesterase family protein n=1 Tax=Priestia megaterium TaxID=1404 RepID=UPI003001F836
MRRKWWFVSSLTFCLCGIFMFIHTQAASTQAEKVAIIAHRGASGYEPEHTMQSYLTAVKQKADYIELDLHMSKDQQLVAIHDYKIDRTTNGTGYVKQYTVKQLQHLNAGKGPKKAVIPTLEEIFRTFGNRTNYYIETKSPHEYPGMEKELLTLMAKYNIHTDHVIVQSFSPESLKTVHRYRPTMKLIQLIRSKQTNMLTDQQFRQIKTYANGIGPNANTLTKPYVQKARSYDLDVHPYTVNDEKQMRTLIEWGVTGMFTNYPDRLYNVLHNK